MIKNSFQSFFPFIFFLVFSLPPVYGEIVFSDLDLSGDNQLLFRAGSNAAGGIAQDALFLTRLSDTAGQREYASRQLSAYPEKMELLDNGRILQIRNAFGVMRVPLSGGLPTPVPDLPSFAEGNLSASGRTEEMASSADGRRLLYLDPVSPALGNLVMLDILSGTKTQAAALLERPEKVFPASWSPDSRFFIYERGGKLYYYMAGSPMPADERIRFIGEGAINSISWGQGGDFYYLRGSTLYHVRGAEVFTRALYTDFLEIGAVMGKIPFEFDPVYDNFWIAPDARSLLVSKGRRAVYFLPLGSEELSGTVPCLMLPRYCSGINVLWPEGGVVTIFVSFPSGSVTKANVWRFDSNGNDATFKSLPPPGTGTSFQSGVLSPDGLYALFWGAGGIQLYDYINWRLLNALGARPVAACLWTGNNEFITGDDQKVERIRLAQVPGASGSVSVSRRELICLSRADQFGFEERSFRVLAKSGDTWFVTDGRAPWTTIDNPRIKAPSQVSAQYRVYLERQGQGIYANLPMVRNNEPAGTFSVFPLLQPGLSQNSRLPRAGSREVALCFDLYDDDQGFPEILDALNCFNIKATFFLNGEFIRRHPLAVSEIVAAGHEAASMFFALIDLSDARYRAGDDFISRGLARNEDEFFRVTGKELALFWHPPWYAVSPAIAASASKAGYVTCGKDVDPLDWVSHEDEKRLGLPMLAPSEMIEYIMEEVKPGSIIPVRLGLLPGGRNGYLFNRINVLLDALVRDGYSLIPVSALIEHTR